MDRFLTIEDRTAIEHRSPAAIYCERYRGDGPPAIVVGKRVLFPEGPYKEWLASLQEAAG